MTLMSKKDIAKTIERFKKEMVGWTIIDVLPAVKDETIMQIVLKRSGKSKTIVVGATDLGFWLDKVIQRI